MKIIQQYCYQLLFFIILLMACKNIFADENEQEAAKAALNGLKVNHFAEHIAVPFEEYFNFDYGANNTQTIYYLKPVVPFRLTPDYDLIVRTIAPVYERTPTYNAQNILYRGYINGWGDLNPTFFIAPAKFNLFTIGLGPSISIPTSTNNIYIGTGKWSIGPELAVYSFPGNWVLGFLTYNLWSIAGDAQRPSVNTFEFQYLASYVFEKGWYLSTNPTITANWKSPGNQQWVVPFGVGAGRAINWDHETINVGLFGYYNAIRPAQVGPNWQLQLQIEFLLPTRFT